MLACFATIAFAPLALKAEVAPKAEKTRASKQNAPAQRSGGDLLHIHYSYESDNKDKLDERIAVEWEKSCQELGRRLVIGGGPYGMGIFDEFACVFDRKFDPEKRDEQQGAGVRWMMSVHDTTSGVHMQLFHAAEGLKFEKSNGTFKVAEGAKTMAELELPQSGATVLLLQNTAFTDIVALQMLYNLPFAYKIAPSASKPKGIKGRMIEDNPYLEDLRDGEDEAWAAPEGLIFYRASEVPGSALLKVELVGKVKRKTKGEQALYKFPTAVVKSKKDVFFAHDAKGRGRFQDFFAENIGDVQGAVAESMNIKVSENEDSIDPLASLQESFAKGYVGIRYGQQILEGIELLKKTTMIGVVAEMRGGILAGIRFYYDKIPQTSAPLAQDGILIGDTQIGASRILLGYAFNLKLGGFINQIDITPKVGLWDFRAKFPVIQANGEVVSRDFIVANEPSFAIEGGVSLLAGDFLLRPWASADVAIVTSQLSSSGVSSRRFGVDGWWTGGPKFHLAKLEFQTAILGFGTFEEVELMGKAGADEEGTFVNSIVYRSAYIGLGLGLSW